MWSDIDDYDNSHDELRRRMERDEHIEPDLFRRRGWRTLGRLSPARTLTTAPDERAS